MTRMSVSCSSKWVAKLCRSVCGDTRFLIPAASAAAWTARLSWRVESGSIGLRPGNSQPRGSNTPRRRPSRHQARNSSSSCGDSMAWRSLRPLPRSIRSSMRSESTSLTLIDPVEKFFEIDGLMARVAARVSDKRVLKLIRAFLKAVVMEDGLVSPVEEGTPQGGPLSPLLSNLVLDDLDKELTRRGLRFCRYADDCNIHVRSRRAGERVMASVSRFLTNKLRLKVNEAKSAVARPEERKFLGFSIANDGSERRIAPKALDKFKEQIREMTSRTRGLSLPQIIEELTPYLVGWRGYFGFCQTPRVLTNLEAWIRRRLRSYLWRQWGNGHNRFKELRRRGVSQFRAAVAAGSPTGFWRMSGHPAVQAALRNYHFDSLGLPRLYVPSPA